jgi:hypothetical protein
MKKLQNKDKKIKAESTYEIKETKTRNGIVYLKIEENNSHFKWIKYYSTSNSGDEIK